MPRRWTGNEPRLFTGNVAPGIFCPIHDGCRGDSWLCVLWVTQPILVCHVANVGRQSASWPLVSVSCLLSTWNVLLLRYTALPTHGDYIENLCHLAPSLFICISFHCNRVLPSLRLTVDPSPWQSLVTKSNLGALRLLFGQANTSTGWCFCRRELVLVNYLRWGAPRKWVVYVVF